MEMMVMIIDCYKNCWVLLRRNFVIVYIKQFLFYNKLNAGESMINVN